MRVDASTPKPCIPIFPRQGGKSVGKPRRKRGRLTPIRRWYTAQRTPLVSLAALGWRGWHLLGAWVLVYLTPISGVSAQGTLDGTMTWALHFSLAPTYFDPADTTGIAAPFTFLYALHGALLKPMPQGLLTPSPAESWAESPDGLVYDFTLHPGLTFRNGTPLTATDAEGVRRGPHRRRPAGGSIGTGPDSDVRLVWTG
jgi:hypothetical protein